MKQRRYKYSVALIAFVLCGIISASARIVDFYSGVCVELADTLDPNAAVPVGCEVVDCCPGCPGNVIDWRIRISGDALDSVVLNFDNLPPEAKQRLKIKGRGHWEGDSLRVRPGETVLSGFNYNPRTVPAVATPRLFANKDALRRLQQAADRNDAAGNNLSQHSSKAAVGRPLGRMEVVIEQLLGKYVINEARMVYHVLACPRRPVNTDHIALNNNIISDNVVVLLDARNGNGACVDDEAHRGAAFVSLGAVSSNGNCNSEVAIFSDDNAMLFLTPVSTWTDLGLDKLIANLTPLVQAPVTVWIADPTSGTQERAEWDVANTNLLFNSNNVGVSFNATYTNVSGNATARQIITDCSNLAALQSSNFFTAGRLNAYYVNQAMTGSNCVGNPNVIFIGTTSNNQTLAHEFGHSFSLAPAASGGHTNGLAGFGTNNIMQGGGMGRTHFSEGQSFRMNVNTTSTLNLNGVRTGPVRNPECAPSTTSNICPPLALDVTPK